MWITVLSLSGGLVFLRVIGFYIEFLSFCPCDSENFISLCF